MSWFSKILGSSPQPMRLPSESQNAGQPQKKEEVRVDQEIQQAIQTWQDNVRLSQENPQESAQYMRRNREFLEGVLNKREYTVEDLQPLLKAISLNPAGHVVSRMKETQKPLFETKKGALILNEIQKLWADRGKPEGSLASAAIVPSAAGPLVLNPASALASPALPAVAEAAVVAASPSRPHPTTIDEAFRLIMFQLDSYKGNPVSSPSFVILEDGRKMKVAIENDYSNPGQRIVKVEPYAGTRPAFGQSPGLFNSYYYTISKDGISSTLTCRMRYYDDTRDSNYEEDPAVLLALLSKIIDKIPDPPPLPAKIYTEEDRVNLLRANPWFLSPENALPEDNFAATLELKIGVPLQITGGAAASSGAVVTSFGERAALGEIYFLLSGHERQAALKLLVEAFLPGLREKEILLTRILVGEKGESLFLSKDASGSLIVKGVFPKDKESENWVLKIDSNGGLISTPSKFNPIVILSWLCSRKNSIAAHLSNEGMHSLDVIKKMSFLLPTMLKSVQLLGAEKELDKSKQAVKPAASSAVSLVSPNESRVLKIERILTQTISPDSYLSIELEDSDTAFKISVTKTAFGRSFGAGSTREVVMSIDKRTGEQTVQIARENTARLLDRAAQKSIVTKLLIMAKYLDCLLYHS